MFGSAHWKVDAIDEYAADRPAAWLDDNLDETCIAWAEGRSAPTLLVETSPIDGLTDEHVTRADPLGRRARGLDPLARRGAASAEPDAGP